MTEYNYAAITASLFKKVVAEIVGWVDMQDHAVGELVKKQKGENKFNIGGE